MKENCNGDYINIDPENTKCVSDYSVYVEVSINSECVHLFVMFCFACMKSI